MKKDALKDLWDGLEKTTAPDTSEIRKKKVAALMGGVAGDGLKPASAPFATLATATGALSGLARRVLRPVVWAPLAAAACIAAVLLLRTPAQPTPDDSPAKVAPALLADGSPVEFVPKNGLNPEQTLISEAVVPENTEISEQIARSAGNTVLGAMHNPRVASPTAGVVVKNAPICARTPENTTPCDQKDRVLTTTPAETTPVPAPATAPEPAGTEPVIEPSPDPWKAMEEEDRQSAKRLSRKRRASIAVFGAGGALSQAKGPIHKSNTVAVNNDMAYNGPGSYGDLGGEAASNLPSNPPSNPASNPESNPLGERATHDLPLNFGISLRIPVTPRLSLESGIAYGFLHSTAGNLHYLGVPLYLQCDVFRGQRAGVYVSGGGSLSYCIAGGGKEHPWQPSASVSAGAEYRIFKGVSVFGEASFSHYFDDGSSLETYYSLNSDTPSFRAGLRFTMSK